MQTSRQRNRQETDKKRQTNRQGDADRHTKRLRQEDTYKKTQTDRQEDADKKTQTDRDTDKKTTSVRQEEADRQTQTDRPEKVEKGMQRKNVDTQTRRGGQTAEQTCQAPSLVRGPSRRCCER